MESITVKIIEETIDSKDFQDAITLFQSLHDDIPNGEICHCLECQVIIPMLSYASRKIDELQNRATVLNEVYEAAFRYHNYPPPSDMSRKNFPNLYKAWDELTEALIRAHKM